MGLFGKKDKNNKNEEIDITNQVPAGTPEPFNNPADSLKRELTMEDYGFKKSDFTIDDFDFADDEDDEETLVVTLPLEDGTELNCDVIMLFELEKQDYVALYPSEGEPDEIYLMRCKYQQGSDTMELEEIEDEDEYKLVCDTFDEIMEQDEWNDLLGEDD